MGTMETIMQKLIENQLKLIEEATLTAKSWLEFNELVAKYYLNYFGRK